MATYDLAFHTRLDDVVVLQTFVETGIQVGDVVTIAGAGHDINGTHTVLSTQDNEYIGQSDEGDFEFDNEVIRLFQFLFRDAGDDLERSVATGTVTFTPSVSWIQASDVTSWLGIDVATANDTAFVTVCVNGRNVFNTYPLNYGTHHVSHWLWPSTGGVMAASGILVDAVNAIKTALTALGLKPVTDPRNARPMSVFIELPVMTSFTYNVGDFRIPVRILAAPPGNQDSGDYLMTTVDTIMNSSIAVVDARPGNASYGGQDIPTYDLTVAIAVKRN
jgi:hypothetical protein